MQFWTIIIILRIVYEIVRAARVKEAPAAPESRTIVRIADPAAFAVRHEYTYRI